MKFNIVVSLNNHNIIGENDDLLIHSKKDLRNFQKITTSGDHKNIVIMGYNTWLSIPESKRPLKDRYNIVLSRNHSITEDKDTKLCRSLKEAFDFSKEYKGEIFVIGGSQIFNECCKNEYYQYLYRIYVTKFDDNYHPRNTTHSFPIQLFNDMKCVETSDKINEICSRPHLDNKPKSFLQEYLSETYIKSVEFTFNIYQNINSINILINIKCKFIRKNLK